VCAWCVPICRDRATLTAKPFAPGAVGTDFARGTQAFELTSPTGGSSYLRIAAELRISPPGGMSWTTAQTGASGGPPTTDR
jgi:hypothetical protein